MGRELCKTCGHLDCSCHNPPISKPKCIHCLTGAQGHGKRGLCWRCYRIPEIRDQYPSKAAVIKYNDQTMAELDALVAEQMKNLPKWWDRESRLKHTPEDK